MSTSSVDRPLQPGDRAANRRRWLEGAPGENVRRFDPKRSILNRWPHQGEPRMGPLSQEAAGGIDHHPPDCTTSR